MGKFIPHVGICECGKKSYPTRKRAKQAAKSLHPDQHLTAYYCEVSTYWHCGHLPLAVRAGDITRGELYGTPQPVGRVDEGR